MSRFKVNLADTTVRDFEAIPTGWYHCKITDCEVKESKLTAKNPGAQYLNFEFTVQDGEHEGAKLWAVASLLPHALFTLKAVAVASGNWSEAQVNSDSFEFDLDDFLTHDILVKALKVPKVKDGHVVEGDFSNDCKSFKPYEGDSPKNAPTGKASLLP